MRLRIVVALLMLAAITLAAQPRIPDAEQLVGVPAGQRLAGPDLDRRTTQVASLLRCPVCQGMSVADSPSEMAINMKRQVRELLARGYTEEQILSYFEQSYGQFVLLRPKFQGVNALVWILPIVALLIGLIVVVVKVRKLEAPAAPVKGGESEDPYVARVREMVKGE